MTENRTENSNMPFVDENSKQKQEEEGATMVEYALLVGLIALVAITAIRYLGNSVSKQFSDIGSSVGG